MCVGWFWWSQDARKRTVNASSSCLLWFCRSPPSLFPAAHKFGELSNDFTVVNILSDTLPHVPKEAHSQHKYFIWTFYISTSHISVSWYICLRTHNRRLRRTWSPHYLASLGDLWARKCNAVRLLLMKLGQSSPLTTASDHSQAVRGGLGVPASDQEAAVPHQSNWV